MSTKISQNIDHKATKNRWIAIIYLIICFQSVFFGSLALCVYALVTLNWKLGLFLGLVSILQRPIKRNQRVIDWVNKYIEPLNYYKSFKRIYEQHISDQEATMFCLHPHSVLSYCMPSNLNADDSKMSKMTGLASRALLSLPFIGAEIRLWGVQSVNARNFKRLMKEKKPIGLLPGGFEQATLTTPKQLRVYIKSRKGFIKYALQYGYTIRPVLTYNQHKAYWTLDKFTSIRLLLNKIKMPAVLFGMGFLWLYLPINLDIINIVGRGISRKPENQNAKITQQQIQQIHLLYISELQRMHAKFREQYGEAPMVMY